MGFTLLPVGFVDRWRRKRRKAADDDAWSEEDIPTFLEAFQPISPTTSDLSRDVHDEFTAACSAHADLKAVYLFDSDFGGQGERLVTVGLVLDDEADVERFPEVSRALRPHLHPSYCDDCIFQHLDSHSLERTRGQIPPIYERT